MASTISIDQSKLTVCASRGNDVIQYRTKIEHLRASDEASRRLCELERHSRALLRAQHNLQEVLPVLETLIRSWVEQKSPSDYWRDPCNRSRFVHAVTLYGACFVKGEGGRQPLPGTLGEESTKHPIYSRIRDYRDKLLAHLDENHEVRADDIELALDVVDPETLRPKGFSMKGNYVQQPSPDEVKSWSEHVKQLISLIRTKLREIDQEVCSILGTVQIIPAGVCDQNG